MLDIAANDRTVEGPVVACAEQMVGAFESIGAPIIHESIHMRTTRKIENVPFGRNAAVGQQNKAVRGGGGGWTLRVCCTKTDQR